MVNTPENNFNGISHASPAEEVKINYFYITRQNESSPKTAFSLMKGTTVDSYAFSFKIGVIRRNVTHQLTLQLGMKGPNNSFAVYPLEGHQISLADGWSGTEYSIDNLITNVSPNQMGEYTASIFSNDVKVAEAATTLFIIEED